MKIRYRPNILTPVLFVRHINRGTREIAISIARGSPVTNFVIASTVRYAANYLFLPQDNVWHIARAISRELMRFLWTTSTRKKYWTLILKSWCVCEDTLICASS